MPEGQHTREGALDLASHLTLELGVKAEVHGSLAAKEVSFNDIDIKLSASVPHEAVMKVMSGLGFAHESTFTDTVPGFAVITATKQGTTASPYTGKTRKHTVDVWVPTNSGH